MSRQTPTQPTQEGRGVMNYSTDGSSYAFSTLTTQFDDELIRRGIVTFEQAMVAKGASQTEARRLALLKFGGGVGGAGTGTGTGGGGGGDDGNFKGRENDAEIGGKSVGRRRREGMAQSHSRNGGGKHPEVGEDENDSDGSEGNEEEDDRFLARYRERRLKELEDESIRRRRPPLTGYGNVLPISRSDWTREINDASSDGQWVVVHLSPGTLTMRSQVHLDTCRVVEGCVRSLAARYTEVKFVTIPATSANESWPAERLPTLFCYRDGKLRGQMVGMADFGGYGVTEGRVEWRLAGMGVLDTELEVDPEPNRGAVAAAAAVVAADEDGADGSCGSGSGSKFRGGMAMWATGKTGGEDCDYDDVD